MEKEMAAKHVHVVPAGDDWIVEEAGQQLSAHRSQAEAERFGRSQAAKDQAALVVHGRNGRVAWRDDREEPDEDAESR
jgi:hypothetical protein